MGISMAETDRQTVEKTRLVAVQPDSADRACTGNRASIAILYSRLDQEMLGLAQVGMSEGEMPYP